MRATSRFLLIDAGNTRIKWTTCELGVDAWPEAEWMWRDALDTLVERWASLRDVRIDAVFVSNVAGAAMDDALRAGVSAVLGDVPVTFVVPTTGHGTWSMPIAIRRSSGPIDGPPRSVRMRFGPESICSYAVSAPRPPSICWRDRTAGPPSSAA